MGWAWTDTFAVLAFAASVLGVLIAIRANRHSEPYFELTVAPVSRPTLGDKFGIALVLTNRSDRPAPQVRLKFLADPENAWEVTNLRWRRVLPDQPVHIGVPFDHNDSVELGANRWSKLARKPGNASIARVSWRSAFFIRFWEDLPLPAAGHVIPDPKPDTWPDPSGPADRSHWKTSGQ